MNISSVIEKIKSNKQGPCLTVILSTHRTSPERTVDPIDAKKTLEQVKEDVAMKYGKSAKILCDKLDELHGQVDFNHNLDGLGFYISNEIAEVIKFPFEVNNKTSIGEFFHLRELIRLESYYEDYLVLDISLDQVKLYRGSALELTPIQNKDFPKKFVDDYEYQKTQPLGTGHGYGLKNAEGDKSVITEERFEKFLKDCDCLLTPYLKGDVLLLLSGASQEIGYYQKVSQHNERVAGKLVGSHGHTTLPVLGQMAFDEVCKARKKLILGEAKELEEGFGRELAVTGIENAWRAAREGKGRILFIEKDFIQKGFVKPQVEHLFLSPPAEIHDTLDDAVESIIRTVLEKDGRVIVTENGVLNKLDRIALLLRYA